MTDNENIKDEEISEVEEIAPQVDIEDELNDKYMRLMAEFDNFKKRTQKEKIQIYTDATADVIGVVLPFVDNLERATSLELESEDAKKLQEGVALIQKQFEEALFGLGIKQIEAVGKEFDPQLHNAVMHIEDENIDTNTIVEEFSKGYTYKEKVIRHSMVKVAN